MIITRRAFAAATLLGLQLRPGWAQSPRDVAAFGVVYDGYTDSTAAFQKACDWASESGSPITLSGPVSVRGPIRYRSNLAMNGISPSASLQAIELPPRFGLLAPQLQTDRLKNVSITNIAFRGSGQPPIGLPMLLRFVSTDNIRVSGCSFSQHRPVLIGLIGSRNVLVENCEFTGFGLLVDRVPNGPAIHIAENQQNQPSQNISIRQNYFHDGKCSAIQAYGDQVSIVGNRIERVEEGAIYAYRDRPGDPSSAGAKHLTISNNRISHVTRTRISATGIEVGPFYGLIENNVISDTQSSGILLLSPSVHVIVRNNMVADAVRDPIFFREHGQIQLIAVAGAESPDWPDDITIEANRIMDNASPKLAPYAIVVRAPKGMRQPIHALRISNNNVAEGFAKQAYWIDPRLPGPESKLQ